MMKLDSLAYFCGASRGYLRLVIARLSAAHRCAIYSGTRLSI
ncbi:unnamed protein product [Acidithrix sp. C25]|nr:unnamed protein product [Acidithrix sp. C25]